MTTVWEAFALACGWALGLWFGSRMDAPLSAPVAAALGMTFFGAACLARLLLDVVRRLLGLKEAA